MSYAITEEEKEKLSNILEEQKRRLKFTPEFDLNRIEVLRLEDFKKNFEDFSRCDSLWKEFTPDGKSIDFICRSFETMRNIIESESPRQYLPYYEEEVMLNNLKLGRVVEDMFNMYRVSTDAEKCPICGASMFSRMTALSRRDNMTKICSFCGQNEAIEDVLNVRE